MSETPGSTPAPEAPKPRLSLTPKAPAPATASAPTPEVPASQPQVETPPPPALQPSSSSTPTTLLAASKPGFPRPALKLSGTPHPSIANPTDAKLEMPTNDSSSDRPPLAVVALSGLAAAAALTFAVLLYLKNQ